MAIGYVLVNAAPRREKAVCEALERIPEVKEFQGLFGDFDVIAKLEAPDYEALGQAIVKRVKSIDGVIATKTLAAAVL